MVCPVLQHSMQQTMCSLPLLRLAVVMCFDVIFTTGCGTEMANEAVACSATIQSGLC